jgi:hypothetical protein
LGTLIDPLVRFEASRSSDGAPVAVNSRLNAADRSPWTRQNLPPGPEAIARRASPAHRKSIQNLVISVC